MPGRGGPGMLGGGGIMAPPGGGAENGVGGIFPCWNAAVNVMVHTHLFLLWNKSLVYTACQDGST